MGHAQRGLPVNQKLSDGDAPPLSTAMRAVWVLLCVFFTVEMVPFFMSIKEQYADVQKEFNALADKKDGGDAEENPLNGSDGAANKALENLHEKMEMFKSTVSSATQCTGQIPMLCILIVFTRLRAKIDLEGTEPSQYTKNTFTVVAVLVLLQALSLVIKGCGPRLKVASITVMAICKVSIYVCILILMQSILGMTKLSVRV